MAPDFSAKKANCLVMSYLQAFAISSLKGDMPGEFVCLLNLYETYLTGQGNSQ